MDLQFITEEAVVDFIDRMDEVSTDSILSDPAIVDMINGGVPQQIAERRQSARYYGTLFATVYR